MHGCGYRDRSRESRGSSAAMCLRAMKRRPPDKKDDDEREEGISDPGKPFIDTERFLGEGSYERIFYRNCAREAIVESEKA